MDNILIVGFTSLAWECWHQFPQTTKDEFLNFPIVDSDLLEALGLKFYGAKKVGSNSEHIQSLFMSQRLGYLSLKHKYFYYMQMLLLGVGKATDPTYIKYYIRSFPGALPNAVETYFKDKYI